MREQFFAFIESGNAHDFEELRNRMLASPAYDPYSRDLSEIKEHLSQGALEKARELSQAHIVNLLLSPGFHLCLSEIGRREGNEQQAQAETAVAIRLVEGILSTGDGTEAAPYRVLRTSDEYDVLTYLRLTFTRQALVYRGERQLDLISTKEGRELFFDVTECMARLHSKLDGIKD